MAVTLIDITGDVGNLVGVDFDPTPITKVWIEANADFLVDTANNQVRLGTAHATVASNGSFTFEDLIATDSDDVDPVEFQYRIWVDYRSLTTRQRVKKNFGWFSVSATSDLTDLVEEQFVDPTWMTTATQTLQDLVDQGTDLLAAQVTLSGISTTDSAVAGLISNALVGPLTNAALSDAYVPKTAAGHQLGAGHILLPENMAFVSPDTFEGYPAIVDVTPMVFLGAADDDGGPVCSVTIANTGGVHRFGEFAMGHVLNTDDEYEDTWAFSCDHGRDGYEEFVLRHRGAVIFRVEPRETDPVDPIYEHLPERAMTMQTDLVLGTAVGSALMAENEAGNAVQNVLRIAGGNDVQIGSTDTWASVELFGGTGNLFTVNAAVKVVNQDAAAVGVLVKAQTGQTAHLYRGTTVGDVTVFAVGPAGNGYFADQIQVDGALKHAGSTAGFFNTTPIAKRGATADATDLASVITLANALKADVVAYGLKTA